MPGSRRSTEPNYGRFLATGAVGGAVLGAVLALSRPAGPTYDRTTALLYLVCFLGALGALAGGGIAVLFEGRKRSSNRGLDLPGDEGRRPADPRPPTG